MILDSLAGVEQERLENVKKTGGTKGTDGEGVGDFPLEGDDHPSLGDVYAQNLWFSSDGMASYGCVLKGEKGEGDFWAIFKQLRPKKKHCIRLEDVSIPRDDDPETDP